MVVETYSGVKAFHPEFYLSWFLRKAVYYSIVFRIVVVAISSFNKQPYTFKKLSIVQ